MKRAGHLYQRIAEPDNLRLAFVKARRGKQTRPEVRQFAANLDHYFAVLQQQFAAESVSVGNYHHFWVYDPKQRRICAPAFRERVLHHAVMNVCEPIFDRRLIFDTYACRKGKGTLRAILRTQHFARRHLFYLKMDIHKFFDTIHHNVLKSLLAGQFKDRPLLRLFDQIIDSYESSPGCGLPIGNLTSQHFANRYLDPLDRMVKQDLRIPAYVRYMDDFVLLADSKTYLKYCWQRIEEYLAEVLKLCLKDATQLNRVSFGLPFLGMRIYPDRIRLAPRSKRRFKKKIRAYENRFEIGIWDENTLARHVNPTLAFIMQAHTKGFRKSVFSDQRAHLKARTA